VHEFVVQDTPVAGFDVPNEPFVKKVNTVRPAPGMKFVPVTVTTSPSAPPLGLTLEIDGVTGVVP
jgi:hypothetical protein